jgi:hypothetical protein
MKNRNTVAIGWRARSFELHPSEIVRRLPSAGVRDRAAIQRELDAPSMVIDPDGRQDRAGAEIHPMDESGAECILD